VWARKSFPPQGRADIKKVNTDQARPSLAGSGAGGPSGKKQIMNEVQQYPGAEPLRLTRRITAWAAAVALLIVGVVFSAPPAYATTDSPGLGSPTAQCQAEFGPSFIGFKVEVTNENTLDGVYTDPDTGFSVTISNTDSDLHTFDYQASWPVNVLVKGGPDSNVYSPPASSGTGLHAPVNPNNQKFYGLSNIVFCWEPDTTAVLSVEKTPNDQTIAAGDDVEFTITVKNNGPGTATGVELTDVLPAGTAGAWTVSSQPAGDPCSITAGTLTCSFGDMAVGEEVEVKVKAATSAEECGVYDNTVTVTSTNAEEVSDTGKVTCQQQPQQQPTLTVTKSGNGSIVAGRDIRFTIRVTNNGPGVATDVSLSDNLPNNTAGSWVISSQPPGSPCSLSGRTLTCSFGDLAVGASRTVTIKAPTGVNRCGTYNNVVNVTSTNAEGVSDRAQVRCRRPAPVLNIRKTADRQRVLPGGQVTYRVWVRNTRPNSVASNVKVCDRIPARMRVLGNGNGSSWENGQLCWTRAAMHFTKKWMSFRYVVRVDSDVAPGTRLRNVVAVGNRRATHTVVVQRPQGVRGVAGGRTPVTG
jgi:uncharacterized repeat protein (TIGR01451 family)